MKISSLPQYLIIPLVALGYTNLLHAEEILDREPIQILKESVIPVNQAAEDGAFFIGNTATANPLPSQPKQMPEIIGMHGNGGNTKVSQYFGPLGKGPEVVRVAGSNAQFMFDSLGRVNGASITLDESYNIQTSIGAFDPQTLELLSKWTPPENQTLNTPYMSQTPEGQILVTTKQGNIYLLERANEDATSGFRVIEHFDLISMGALDNSHLLLGASLDKKDNIWFYTGGIVGNGDNPGSDTVLGYIDQEKVLHQTTIENQIIENGIAVNQNGIYVLTGPAGVDNVPNAKGNVLVFEADKNEENGIKIVWENEYQAGSYIKPGGFARGSGSTTKMFTNKDS